MPFWADLEIELSTGRNFRPGQFWPVERYVKINLFYYPLIKIYIHVRVQVNLKNMYNEENPLSIPAKQEIFGF